MPLSGVMHEKVLPTPGEMSSRGSSGLIVEYERERRPRRIPVPATQWTRRLHRRQSRIHRSSSRSRSPSLEQLQPDELRLEDGARLRAILRPGSRRPVHRTWPPARHDGDGSLECWWTGGRGVVEKYDRVGVQSTPADWSAQVWTRGPVPSPPIILARTSTTPGDDRKASSRQGRPPASPVHPAPGCPRRTSRR
jgi:hypothetical protein